MKLPDRRAAASPGHTVTGTRVCTAARLRVGLVLVAAVLTLGRAVPQAQGSADSRGSTEKAASGDARSQALDEVLDVDVHDGLVYYRALKTQRGRLDAYVSSLAAVPVDSQPRDDQIAFWLNAYNTIVLQTVIDHYPIVPRSKDYPARSIRQIPGAFEKATHRVGEKTVTLDQIEQTILPAFHDARLFLALGRGAVGSGRLLSETYSASRLQDQLAEVAGECLTRAQCVDINRTDNIVRVSSIFSWREKDFVTAYADKAPALFGDRSPIERAVLAFVDPKLLTTEREFLAKNQFKVEYIPFDWTLNDLTGRGGR
jgi:hypothetical protein